MKISHHIFLGVVCLTVAFGLSPQNLFAQAQGGLKFLNTKPIQPTLQSLWLVEVNGKSGEATQFDLKLQRNGTAFYHASTQTVLSSIQPSVVNLLKSGLQYQSFSDPELERYTLGTGLLPKGAYAACVEMSNGASSALTCIEFVVDEALQIVQLYPPNGFELQENVKRPNFTWTLSPIVARTATTYNLKLYDLDGVNGGTQAVLRNQPIHQASGLANGVYAYPMDAVELQRDHRYAWIVEVEGNGSVVATSPIWEFKFVTGLGQVTTNAPHAYVDLNNRSTLREVLADREVHLKFKHTTNAKIKLEYGIQEITGKMLKSKVPDYEMQPGENYFSVDLSSVRGLKKNRVYLLKITGLGEDEIPLVFRHIEI